MTLEELRDITNLLLQHLHDRGVRSVQFREDYYWTIPREQRLDMSREPTTFVIGQLSDDLQELDRVRTRDRDILAQHLVWLASILQELGETVVG